jgi:polysaccharide biosynthesis protein PslJ
MKASYRNTRPLQSSPLLAAVAAVVVGGIVGSGAAFGPLYAAAGVFALAVAYALLTSTIVGVMLAFAIITLLPFGTLPFKTIITPNLLTLALGGLLMVWGLRMLARSDTYELRLTPLGLPILGFLGFTLFSLIRGAHGVPDPRTLHNYVKFILGVLFFFSVVNSVRNRKQARVVLRGLMLCGGLAALVGIVLTTLPDETALRLLVRLGPIGYPTIGRVLRYVEDNPDGMERVIGLSVDPNGFGGMLALVIALSVAQLFAARPLLRRDLLAGLVGSMGVALLFTFSRAALFGIIAVALYLATIRYRRLWWAMLAMGVLAAGLLLGLGLAEDFTRRLSEGVQFQDQAQQMRLAEFQNAWNIIKRYPLTGIGFGQAPEIDLVAGVSSIYLTIAERMGLIGLAIFLAIVAAWLIHSWLAAQQLDEERAAWLLGTQSGIIAALTVGLADHYFFNIEFSHMVALFWGTMGLGMAIIALPEQTTPPND